MQEGANKTLIAYRQGVANEREINKSKARSVIKNLINADASGLIQNLDDVIELIKVEFDLGDDIYRGV